MKKSGNVEFFSHHGRKSVYDLRFNETLEPKPLLIFCHGFKGFKDWGHFNLIANSFANSGMIVLKFNFTFNGGTSSNVIDFPDLESFAENNYLKELQDIHHMINMVKAGKVSLENWNGEIYLLGHSRGGGMVTIAAHENSNVSKIVSWAGISCCFSRLPDEEQLLQWKTKGVKAVLNGRTQQNMPMNYQFVEVLYNYRERLSIETASRKMNKPHLIVHGTEDSAVEVEDAKRINFWSKNSQIHLVEGANHVFGGKHPWNEEELPKHTKEAIASTINFLLD